MKKFKCLFGITAFCVGFALVSPGMILAAETTTAETTSDEEEYSDEEEEMSWVQDDYDLLTYEEWDTLNQELSDIYEKYHYDAVLWISTDTDIEDVRKHAAEFMQEKEIGYGDSHEGMCIFNQPDTRDIAIVFRGDRLDHMFTNQPYDRIAGQWKGITFTSTSFYNTFDFCDIHSGCYGIKCDSSDISEIKLKVENSIVHNMKGDCMTLINSNVFVGNSQITNALGNCITIRGGNNQFVHCTIGNFYPFEGNRGKSVFLYNSLNGRRLPLKNALFENCIISGWSDDELFASFLDDTKDSVWGSKNFKKFDYDNLVFDFRLDSLSKARNNADIYITKQYYPLDRKGKARLENDNKSDIGCYEFE